MLQIFCCLLVLSCDVVLGFDWSTREYSIQAKKTTCIPIEHYENKTLGSRDKNYFTDLGKVTDAQVCGLLCCEVESCDLALFEESHCYSVKCADLKSCDFVLSKAESEILTFKRKSGSDIWSTGDQSKNAAPFYKENKAKIVTKQAVKSTIPEISTVSGHKDSSLIALSNQAHADSPMDALLQKESSMIKNKQENALKKSSVEAKDHYMKAEEKSDMTALQENETTSQHPKLTHRRKDLRHTLISPITIGAFTCMAVIAVSGFAMAIIKYQRERKDFEDKTTQKP